MHGVSKTKVVPLSHMTKMMKGSEQFTGAALDGVPQDMSDPEICPIPDPSSCIVIPWKTDTAWFASELDVIEGPGAFEACSRRILHRQVDRAAELGFGFDVGTEAEFYVLKDIDPVQSIAKAFCFVVFCSWFRRDQAGGLVA